MPLEDRNLMGLVMARQNEDGSIVFIWNKLALKQNEHKVTAITTPDMLAQTVQELNACKDSLALSAVEKELARQMLEYIKDAS